MPAKKTSNTGHRLTTQQKNAIAKAPAETTNTELAEKFGTSMQTIARYRTATSTKSVRAAKAKGDDGDKVKHLAGGIETSETKDYIVIKIPKKGLLKGLVSDLLS